MLKMHKISMMSLFITSIHLVSSSHAKPQLANQTVVKNKFDQYGLITDKIVETAPEKMLMVKFPNNFTVELGNILTFDQAWELPGFIWWDADPGCFHTLIFLNADSPNDKFPRVRQYLHWMVGNIPEARVENGKILCSYLMPLPPPTQYGIHRLVFLVYKQPAGLIEFTEEFLPALPLPKTRLNFTVENIVKKYNLIGPVAGNFYRIDWQQEVNHLRHDVQQ